MKKGFIKYSLLWLVALGIFNAVAFLMPNELNSTFWIGYGAVSAAFVLQLLSTAWFFNKDLLQKRLGQIPVPVFCMMGLIALLAGSVAFAVTGMTLIVIASYVVVGVQYIANIVVIVASGKSGAATGFIPELKKNTAELAKKAENNEIKALADEVANAAASADTRSDAALAGVENKILAEMEKFSSAVEASDLEGAQASAKQLLSFIKERNTKCRLFLK
jgi:hypothetical protein